jgi:hypothetical protein
MKIRNIIENISSQQRAVGQLPADFDPPQTSPQLSGPYPGRNATRGYLVGEGEDDLSWSDLDTGLTVEDRMDIFETHYSGQDLRESLDPKRREQFQNLWSMGDQPQQNRSYIVVPLALIADRVRQLDPPRYLRYLGDTQDQRRVFLDQDRKITYPSSVIRDLALYNVFTFQDPRAYDRFRNMLTLSFDVQLPEIEIKQSKKGMAEGHADQQRKIFQRNSKPVGEVGIDRESSPGVGQYYMKHYASGTDNSGYDSFEDALGDLRHVMKQSIYGELREQGMAEATGNPGMPHDFTAVQPGAEVWYKGRFAGWTTGKAYDDPYGKHGKMVAFEPNPSEFPGDEGRVLSLPYDEVSLRKSTSIGKLKGPEQGVAEGLNEMDKSAPQPGRDGKVSHSTYGSRDKKGSDYFKGKEAPSKPVTAKQMSKDALDILKKQGVAESGWNPLDDERREQRRMDQERRQFRRDELEAELGDEEERYRQIMRGTWYVIIDGRAWQRQGQPVAFRGREAARRAAQTIKNRDPNKTVAITQALPTQSIAELTDMGTAVAAQPTVTPTANNDQQVEVIFFGVPGKDYWARDAWDALEEVLPNEYPRGSERAQLKIAEVQKHGGAVVTVKPLAQAKKLVDTFRGYGIKARINASGINESVIEQERLRIFREAVAKGMTSEDVLSTMKRRLGDYLQDVATAIRKDPDLVDKIPQAVDQIGPAVRTLKTDDGHEIRIHGNEDDGFRVSIRNRTIPSRFRSLDEAEIATEMYCARRRQAAQLNDDYRDEA